MSKISRWGWCSLVLAKFDVKERSSITLGSDTRQDRKTLGEVIDQFGRKILNQEGCHQWYKGVGQEEGQDAEGHWQIIQDKLK